MIIKYIKKILYPLIFLILLAALNLGASYYFFRIDFTSEGKYKLSESSKKLAKDLDDIIYIKIFLEGDFPANFKHFQTQIKETLDEFKAYGNDNIQYEFINPNKYNDKKIRGDFQKDLYRKGLIPTTISVKEKDGSSKKTIWPGAIFTYGGKEQVVNFLKAQLTGSVDRAIQGSIESLEYEVANMINKITTYAKPKVGFIDGHGELNEYESAALKQLLSPFYSLERVFIQNNINSLCLRKVNPDSSVAIVPKYKAIILAKPVIAFSEKEKFIIDQYIMYGGRVVWLIDGTEPNLDSLKNNPYTIALDLNLNLSDQLFNYGVRINHNLLQNIQATAIPIVTGQVGNKPQTELLPWFFYPILKPSTDHPIVNNLNLIRTEFVSTIDTIAKAGIKKIPLLKTNQYSKINNTPTRISLSDLSTKPDIRLFNQGEQTAAYLLSGKFESIFKHRNIASVLNNKFIGFKQACEKENHMVVISDGDIIKNSFNTKSGQYLPIGFDRYSGIQYGNADFILNIINFLCDDIGLMEVRNKKFKIRLLDKVRKESEKTYWQIINILVPIILITLISSIYYLIRKQRYTK